jgi:hypothetical protein
MRGGRAASCGARPPVTQSTVCSKAAGWGRVVSLLMNRLCLLFLVLLAGCFKESQGNSRSVGVPGVPSWSAKTPANAQNSSTTSAPGASMQALSPCPQAESDANGKVWLDELNRWREMTGLRPVRENVRMSQGSYAHARYLVKAGPPDDASVRTYTNTRGAAAHTEDPSSPFYSSEGADAANGGKGTLGGLWTANVSWNRNQCADVQGLLIAPFHRFSLLAPWATVAGYAAFGDNPRRAAALALWGILPKDSGGIGQVEFPPDGSTLAIAAMNNLEWPSPFTSCPGYGPPVGLPITLQMGSPGNVLPGGLAISLQKGSAVKLESFSLRDVTKDDTVEACAFDAFTYTNPDAVVQAHGINTLRLYRAVVLIPRNPLRPGHRYTVRIKTDTNVVNWTFGIAANAVIRTPLINGEPLR